MNKSSIIDDILSEEYNQLALFFFIGQILGISCLIGEQFFFIGLALLFLIILVIKKSDSLIHIFLKIILSGLIFGAMVTLYKIYINKTPDLAGEYIVNGKIVGIKPRNNELILTIKVDFINSIYNEKADKILAKVDAASVPDIMIGNEISCLVNLNDNKSRKWFMSSGNFELQYRINGISGNGYIIEVFELKSNNVGFLGLLYKIRKSIYNTLVDKMGENGHFVAALILGETGRLNNKIIDNARNTGVSHILCVSGLHLSIICFIFFKITRLILNCFDSIALKFNVKKISAAIAIIASVCFLLISGMQIASTRAWIMTALGIFGIFIDKLSLSIRVVFLTGIIMLSFNPEYLYHPSFQLSYLAVMAIISSSKVSEIALNLYTKCIRFIKQTFNKRGVRAVYRPNSNYINSESKSYVWAILEYSITNIYITSLVSLVTMPVVIYYFYFFANYSILANLVIVPITSFILMPLSIVSIIAIPFGLEYYLMFILNFCVTWTTEIIDYFAKLPFAVFNVGHISYNMMSFCVMAFLLFVICESFLKYIFGICLAIGIIGIFMTPRPSLIVMQDMVIIDDSTLEIHAKKYKKQTFKKITNWFGRSKFKYYKDIEDGLWYYKNIAIINREITNCEHFAQYKIINMLDNTKCKIGDISLNEIISNGYYKLYE